MLNLTEEAIFYLCHHRTGYHKPESKQKQFSEDMEREIQRIMPALPKTAEAILDIGCGLGGIDVMLYRHYQGNVNLYLIDKTEMAKPLTYNVGKREFYNSMPVTKQFLESNGVDPNKIFLQEATDDNRILFDKKFDIIISLISWGFHYSIDTYLEEVYQKLASPGILILDTGEEQAEILREKFGNCEMGLGLHHRALIKRGC